MTSKDASLKEKLKQALESTFKVISDDFKIKNKSDEQKNSKNFELFDLENINTKIDFVKARADSDSLALKKKFLTLGFTKKTYLQTHHVSHYIRLLKK